MKEKFMRESNGNLETSITSYKKDRSEASIIACIHMAEQDYFKALENKANEHGIVLYEPTFKAENKRKEADSFGLVYQPFAIDYSNLPKNWVCAEDKVKTRFKDYLYLGLAVPVCIVLSPLFLCLRKDLKSGSKKGFIETTLKMLNSTPYKQLNSLISRMVKPRTKSAVEKYEELNKGYDSIAFLYGAGHTPYLEKCLLNKGYKQIKKDWVTAIRTGSS